MQKTLHAVFVIFIAFGLTSCFGETLIKKRNLEVQTKMSETIFLEPVAAAKRTIYVDIRNTSDKELAIATRIQNALINRGYRLVDDPQAANFMLQANVLRVGKSDLTASQSALESGFGGAIIGRAVADEGRSAERNTTLIGAAIGFVGEALVEDTLYNMITDLQIRERPLAGETVTQRQNTSASQGSATRMTQTVSGGEVGWKTYRSRVVSTANKANLEFDEARGELENGLVRSIGGIF